MSKKINCLCQEDSKLLCFFCEEKISLKKQPKEMFLKLKAFKTLHKNHALSSIKKKEQVKLFFELIEMEAALYDQWFSDCCQDWIDYEKSKAEIQLIKPPQKTAKMEGSDELPF